MKPIMADMRFLLVILLLMAGPTGFAVEEIQLVSVALSGSSAAGISRFGRVNADGRYVVFESEATNVVDHDVNLTRDVFVRDMTSKLTQLVSLAEDQRQANDPVQDCTISDDGRYVAFSTGSDNLILGDSNYRDDVFRRDVMLDMTQRFSVGAASVQGNGASIEPALGGNNNLVVFTSLANNLISNDFNNVADVFMRDTSAGTTIIISRGINQEIGNGASRQGVPTPDGKFIAFSSAANNLVADDDNGQEDIFVRILDPGNERTERISVAVNGSSANGSSWAPSISSDGKFVLFTSEASNLIVNDNNSRSDVFLRNRQTQTTQVISTGIQLGNGASWCIAGHALSGDGRYAVFTSFSNNLSAFDSNSHEDVYIADLVTNTVSLISRGKGGVPVNGWSADPAISSDGQSIVFSSIASNLINGDGNGMLDVFYVRRNQAPVITVPAHGIMVTLP